MGIGKFKFKLVAVILVVTLVSLFSYLTFVTIKNVDYLKEEMSQNLTTVARVVGNNLVPELAFFDPESAQETLEKISILSYVKNAVVFHKSGEKFAEFQAPNTPPPGPISRAYGSRFEDGYFVLFEKIVFNNKYYGDIFLRASTEELNRKIWKYIRHASGFILFLLVLVGLLTWRLQRYISNPILNLAESFKTISRSRDYSHKLKKVSSDEIGTLYDGFNEMMEQIHLHQEELKQHKENLENLVEERTKELKQKNLLLRKSKDDAENANRLKSEFLANMSHEIRTPMNAILGFTDILMEDEENAEKKFYLTTVKKSGEDLLKLINNILDFSKIEANRLEIVKDVFSTRKLFNHLETIFSVRAREKDLYFRLNGLETLPEYVYGDSHRLKQVLLNVLGNAFKFTHSGGVVMDCGYSDGGMTACIKDSGIGISQEQQKTIFAPFTQADGSTTRKYGGTGLGLSISSRLVYLMDGIIRVQSDLGKGSTFVITIPLPLAETGEDSGKYSLFTADTVEGKTIAIIGAAGEGRSHLNSLLTRHHYRVVELEGGEGAAEKVFKEKVDLVLLDFSRDYMKGSQAHGRLKQDIRTAHLPVFLYGRVGGKLRPFAGGIADYIQKSVSHERLLARLFVNLSMYPKAKNILLLDADKELLELFCGYLRWLDYNCSPFDSAVQAFQKIKTGLQPDLIILDTDMPFMDGYEFLKLLRSKGKRADIPMIIVSGRDFTPGGAEKLSGGSAPLLAGEAEAESDLIASIDNFFSLRRDAARSMVRRWRRSLGEDEQVCFILMEAIGSLPAKILDLGLAIENKDFTQIDFLSHSIKGTGVNLNMTEIVARCREMNDEIQKTSVNIEKVQRLYIELNSIIHSIPGELYSSEKRLERSQRTGTGSINILVAEDDEVNQKLIHTYFKRMGKDCDIASNGKTVLEMMEKKTYDVLFLDIQMPIMDGLQTIEKLRRNERFKDIHVVALTANAVKGDKEKYIAAGCNDYLSKPVSLESLKQKLLEAFPCSAMRKG